MKCDEVVYDVAGIRLFPVGVLNFDAPPEILNKHVSSAFISGDISTGLIPFNIEDGTLKETPDRSVAGDFYKVLLSCDITDFSGTVFNAFKAYQKTKHDVLVYSSIGEVMLVRSDKSGYKVTHSSKEGVTTLEFEIINFSGIQFVTD